MGTEHSGEKKDKKGKSTRKRKHEVQVDRVGPLDQQAPSFVRDLVWGTGFFSPRLRRSDTRSPEAFRLVLAACVARACPGWEVGLCANQR